MLEWVEGITNRCLQDVLLEAYIARLHAVQDGAERYPGCKRVLDKADATIDQIRFGRYEEEQACRRAAVAVRKYTMALACASPIDRHKAAKAARDRDRGRSPRRLLERRYSSRTRLSLEIEKRLRRGYYLHFDRGDHARLTSPYGTRLELHGPRRRPRVIPGDDHFQSL